MSRRRGVMSENFKYELAKDLGFYDVVQREGWSGIRTQDAGNMVKRAIQIAQQHLANQYVSPPTNAQYSPSPYRQPVAGQPVFNGAASSYQQTGQGTQRPY